MIAQILLKLFIFQKEWLNLLATMVAKKKKQSLGNPEDHYATLITNISAHQSKAKFIDVTFLCKGGKAVSANKVNELK